MSPPPTMFHGQNIFVGEILVSARLVLFEDMNITSARRIMQARSLFFVFL